MPVSRRNLIVIPAFGLAQLAGCRKAGIGPHPDPPDVKRLEQPDAAECFTGTPPQVWSAS